jgi:hypothetical protein
MSESVWEAFGIKRVSPSAIKTFNEERGMWFAKYVAKVSEDAGPAAWRGDAVEAGLNAYAYGQPNAGQIAAQTFEHRAMEYASKNDGELHPDHDAEEAKVPMILERAIAAWDAEGLTDLGKPASSQQWCEVNLPGIDIPVGGKWDWGFGKKGEGFSLDLKTANSIPTPGKDEDGNETPAEPKLDHAIQVTCYARSRREQQAKILYVSGKEYKTEPRKGTERRHHCLITLDAEQLDFYERLAVHTITSMKELLNAALALTEYECTSKERALARLCRPDFMAKGGGFYSIWKPDFQRAALEAVPAWNAA